ncbi:hypothetical protein VTK73DRAFT_757 [Phialemonium thermophilum]|uniref:Pyridoxamine 5'-phosphate oxidase Alr4036 family FMN-binding domain-containing protein n=1 Tax=Phialemonium thermophilum TaxID=223376 RepID=A0ABR3XDU6_9PEZI
MIIRTRPGVPDFLVRRSRVTRMLSHASAPAPWRELFLEHINTMPQPTFALSTLHPVPASETATPSPSSLPVVPRARTCICRGLWGTLPANTQNPAPRNPPIWESDLPVLTTDARSEKAAELVDTAGSAGLAVSAAGATGGGGPIEAVFWADRAMTQWRIRGTALILGPDVEGAAGKPVRDLLLSRMRRTDQRQGVGGRTEDWSWSREVTAHFGNLSPIMRGTFRGPPPGSSVAIPPEPGQRLGQEVHDLEDELARANFRVVVIVPTEVDQVDLSDQKRPRRWLFTYRGQSREAKLPGGEVIGEWEKVEVWP